MKQIVVLMGMSGMDVAERELYMAKIRERFPESHCHVMTHEEAVASGYPIPAEAETVYPFRDSRREMIMKEIELVSCIDRSREKMLRDKKNQDKLRRRFYR